MPLIHRITRASLVMIGLCFIVSIITSAINRDSAQDGIISNAQASMERQDVTLADGQIMTALDSAAFDQLLIESQERPVFMMVYASWCPHCKRMFTELNTLQKKHNDTIHITAISIDNNVSLAAKFANDISPLRLSTYIMKNGKSYYEISERLRNFGLRFQGGISKSVGVPYNTVFYKGKPVAEISGAMSGDTLSDFIEDIVTNAGKS